MHWVVSNDVLAIIKIQTYSSIIPQIDEWSEEEKVYNWTLLARHKQGNKLWWVDQSFDPFHDDVLKFEGKINDVCEFEEYLTEYGLQRLHQLFVDTWNEIKLADNLFWNIKDTTDIWKCIMDHN